MKPTFHYNPRVSNIQESWWIFIVEPKLVSEHPSQKVLILSSEAADSEWLILRNWRGSNHIGGCCVFFATRMHISNNQFLFCVNARDQTDPSIEILAKHKCVDNSIQISSWSNLRWVPSIYIFIFVSFCFVSFRFSTSRWFLCIRRFRSLDGSAPYHLLFSPPPVPASFSLRAPSKLDLGIRLRGFFWPPFFWNNRATTIFDTFFYFLYIFLDKIRP